MWPVLMELSSEICDSSHAGQKIFTRWQQISTATILGLDFSFWKRSQRLLSIPWATQTCAHTAVRVVCKVQVPRLCSGETWREWRPSEPHCHQGLQNYNQHATVELVKEHMGNLVLKGFAGAEEHSKAAFKKWKANVQTYSKTFWKERILWTAGKNRRPVFDINLRGREKWRLFCLPLEIRQQLMKKKEHLT